MAQLTRVTLIALAMVLLEGEHLHFALYHHSYLVAIAKKASNSPLRDTVPVSFFTVVCLNRQPSKVLPGVQWVKSSFTG